MAAGFRIEDLTFVEVEAAGGFVPAGLADEALEGRQGTGALTANLPLENDFHCVEFFQAEPHEMWTGL